MKILFIGLGSIGQRHLQNLQYLITKNVLKKETEIFALRRPGSKARVIKNGKARTVANVAAYYGITTIISTQKALALKPDIVFITNPSAQHVTSAIPFAQSGSHLFIEKPLGATLQGVATLKAICKKNKRATFIGYQTRFHPLYELVKKQLHGHQKKLISAQFTWGTYLPDHHPYEDYTKGYAARKNLGGGAVLGLSHELDVIYSLFGLPKRIATLSSNQSDLNMNTEDTINTLLDYPTHPVSLALSYAHTKETREWRFQFTDRLLHVDLVKNSYTIYNRKGSVAKQGTYHIERNALFIQELKHFLACVRGKEKPLVSLTDGLGSLKMALGIQQAIKSKKWVRVLAKIT